MSRLLYFCGRRCRICSYRVYAFGVTKPTAILSGKKCTVAFVRVRVYVRFVAMGRAVALLGVQTGTRKVRI